MVPNIMVNPVSYFFFKDMILLGKLAPSSLIELLVLNAKISTGKNINVSSFLAQKYFGPFL